MRAYVPTGHKQFKLKHWENKGTQQQNFSEQHRHQN